MCHWLFSPTINPAPCSRFTHWQSGVSWWPPAGYRRCTHPPPPLNPLFCAYLVVCRLWSYRSTLVTAYPLSLPVDLTIQVSYLRDTLSVRN